MYARSRVACIADFSVLGPVDNLPQSDSVAVDISFFRDNALCSDLRRLEALSAKTRRHHIVISRYMARSSIENREK